MEKDISGKMLKNCFLETTEDGFTLWIREKGNKQHWLIDASTFFLDGAISLGLKELDLWKHKAVLDEENNGIRIVEVTKRKTRRHTPIKE